VLVEEWHFGVLVLLVVFGSNARFVVVVVVVKVNGVTG